MLAQLSIDDLGGGITLLDIGSSGQIDPKWKPIESRLNLIGFDPNAEECQRMEQLPHPFHSARYLPYAVADKAGMATLYHTANKYCFSLLEPNTPWLDRFYYKDFFKVVGTSTVNVKPLTDVAELKAVEIDAIKIDTQGLELPILSAAEPMLEQAFYVEPEAGFTENYKGESLFPEVNQFLRARNFLLFDFNDSHRIARNNVFQNHPTGKEQPLWTEAVYLKDYIALSRTNSPQLKQLTRAKALKVLLLCALQGCRDYGYECAKLFRELHLITDAELETLATIQAWDLPVTYSGGFGRRLLKRLIAGTVAIMPVGLRQATYEAALYTTEKSRRYR